MDLYGLTDAYLMEMELLLEEVIHRARDKEDEEPYTNVSFKMNGINLAEAKTVSVFFLLWCVGVTAASA